MDHYYCRHDLAKFSDMGKESPALWEKFLGWYNAVFAEGALSEREKSLIALAVAHTVQCPYCIDAYTTTCLEKGSNLEQMTEAALALQVIFHRRKLARDVGVRHGAVDRFSERPDAGLDRQPSDIDGPLGIDFPSRRAGRQRDE